MKIGESNFDVSSFDGVEACQSAQTAVCVLKEKWQENTGIELKTCGNIILSENKKLERDAYSLCINKNGIKIYASGTRGFVMGAETLIKLINDSKIPECEITDTPRLKFRGIHMFLPGRRNFDFAYRLVKYLLSPMGYNVIILELAGGMQF